MNAGRLEVAVEVLPGLAPLILPASQVVSIRYGSREDEPTRIPAPQQAEATPEEKPEVLPARAMAPEFSRRLATPVALERREFRHQDVIEILEAAAKAQNIPLTIRASVRRTAEAKRRCTLQIPAEQTFDGFLRQNVTRAMPWLRFEYGFDEVEVSVKPE